MFISHEVTWPFHSGAKHFPSRDFEHFPWSPRNWNYWTNPCFIIMLSLHWHSFLPLLCLCSILQLLLAGTSNLIYLYYIVNHGLLFLHLGFKLPEQLRFVKLNELSLVPAHFADVGLCKPGTAVPPKPTSGSKGVTVLTKCGLGLTPVDVQCTLVRNHKINLAPFSSCFMSCPQNGSPIHSRQSHLYRWLPEPVGTVREDKHPNHLVLEEYDALCHLEIGKAELCSILHWSLLKEQYILVFLPFLTSFPNHY